MRIERFDIDGPVLFTPEKHGDDRGFFMESFCLRDFQSAIGQTIEFVQDNLAYSEAKDTLRGLHYQAPPCAQGKLISCMTGRITDVIVDIRRGSDSFGRSLSVTLDCEDRSQLWVPSGFLHGYVTRMKDTLVSYKVTDYYAPEYDGAVIWDDPDLAINWHVEKPIISPRDKAAKKFADFKSPF